MTKQELKEYIINTALNDYKYAQRFKESNDEDAYKRRIATWATLMDIIDAAGWEDAYYEKYFATRENEFVSK